MRVIIDLQTKSFDALFHRFTRTLGEALHANEIEPNFTVQYVDWEFPPIAGQRLPTATTKENST